jgi:magnesium-transporting ATPase (P-type)
MDEQQLVAQKPVKLQKSIFKNWRLWVGIVFVALLLSVLLLILFVYTYEPTLPCGAYEVC